MVCGDLHLTYRQLAERVARLVAGLGTFGVKPGDRIALLHCNCHRVLEIYFAAVHAEAVLVPLNVRLTAHDLAFIIDDTETRLLVADEGFRDLAVAATEIATTPCELLWSFAYEDLLADMAPAELVETDVKSDAPANIYYTSGTTGHQKGVILTHRNIYSHALATIAELRLSDKDVWAHVAPMFHLADAWATWATTWVGGRHIFCSHFVPRQILQTMADEAVTATNLVPTMLNDLVHEPAARSFDLSAFRLVMSGGAPISPHLVQQVSTLFGCEYIQTYGLTETSPYLTFSLLKQHLRQLPVDEQMRYRCKTGRAAIGVTLRVVDEDGNDVPADNEAVGEILARGERITPGYWRLPEITAEAFRDGWFHTGDLATIDQEGYLNIVDRIKDVILSGGELVYSTEVEHVLAEHEAVFEAAVIALPDERLGERVHAVIVCKPGCITNDNEIMNHCRQHLAGYKIPRSLEIIDSLPRTGSGKINKRLLREPG